MGRFVSGNTAPLAHLKCQGCKTLTGLVLGVQMYLCRETCTRGRRSTHGATSARLLLSGGLLSKPVDSARAQAAARVARFCRLNAAMSWSSTVEAEKLKLST